MAKRFSDTDLWKKQRWFRKLSPTYKLVFCYIKDQCNHAGIWDIDCSDLVEDLGIDTFDLLHFVNSINTEYDKISGEKTVKERVFILNENKLWITGFIQFQYEGKDRLIKANNNMVKGALYILDNISLNPCQPLPTLANPCAKMTVLEYSLVKFIKINEKIDILRQGLATLKEKDKVKDSIKLNQQKNNQDGNAKQFVNFRTQGEDLYAEKFRRYAEEQNQV